MLDIDLSRHAVIEASAGTGKTHTMVELAVRLLTEPSESGGPRATIDGLLLVTFTEKAAGELQDRLRRRLGEVALGADPAVRQAARDALDGFERASISTIHAFCHQVLRAYAFENREPFVLEQTDDGELRLELLREHMRTHWQAGGAGTAVVLRHAGFPRVRGAESDWENAALGLLGRYNPAAGDRILPDAEGDEPLARLEAMASGVRALLAEVRALVPDPLDPEHPEDHPLYLRMKTAGAKAVSLRPATRDYLAPLLRLAAEGEGLALRGLLERAYAFRESARGAAAFKRGQWQCLAQLLPEDARDRVPEPGRLGEVAERLERALLDAPREQLLADTVRDVAGAVARTKRERGWITFDDMVSRVRDALCDPERGEALAQALRARYRYAVVDEFQDTDTVQWTVFRRLFVEEGDGRLFVVGDPKQAIYGFRGADVRAYLAARRWLVHEADAVSYDLATNYRSSPELIEALNWLFEQGAWFPQPGGIDYTRVEAAPPGKAKGAAVHDTSGRDALTLVEMPEATRAAATRRSFARFIALEVGHLLGLDTTGPRLRLADAREPEGRPLRPDDIAVLVQRGGEAAPVEEALRAAGIPYSRYKQAGLWASAEALHLRAVLAAIADPEDAGLFLQALLTRFFRAAPGDLLAARECPPEHPVRLLFARWVELAERRDWPRLFRSLLEETPVLLEDARRAPEEAERRSTNYRHLLELLMRQATGEGLGISGLVEWLTARCEGLAPPGEGEDLQRIETDRGKVQILTMHASKGLEFPVVFIAGGFTARASLERVHRYYDPQRSCWVHDLTMSHAQESHDEEEAANRRLLYVALTRAATKLYVPKYPCAGETVASKGPLVTVVRPSLATAFAIGTPGSVATVSWPDAGAYRADPLAEVAAAHKAGAAPNAAPAPAAPATVAIPDDRLLPPEPGSPPLAAIGRRTTRVHSYTSLQSQSGATAPVEDLRERDEADAPLLEEAPVIPPGPDTGTLVHELMETLLRRADLPALLEARQDLQALAREHIARWLPRLLAREETIVPAVADLARRGLTAPLAALGCSVAEIPADDRFPEVEFYLPIADPACAERYPELELVAGPGGPLLHGFIDLILRRDGRYVVLDWKTNLLADYAPDALRDDMAHHGYGFQCRLYALALHRQIRDRTHEFAGGHYVYLRGLGDAPGIGVVHLPPAELDPETTARALVERAAAWERPEGEVSAR